MAMEKLHGRMPIFVPREVVGRWLDRDQDSTDRSCQSADPGMSIYAVLTRVDSPLIDEEAQIEFIDSGSATASVGKQRNCFE